jgi:hypothetical protein
MPASGGCRSQSANEPFILMWLPIAPSWPKPLLSTATCAPAGSLSSSNNVVTGPGSVIAACPGGPAATGASARHTTETVPSTRCLAATVNSPECHPHF